MCSPPPPQICCQFFTEVAAGGDRIVDVLAFVGDIGMSEDCMTNWQQVAPSE